MAYSFTVPGRPVPAVRMTQRSKWVDEAAQRYLAYKQAVGWSAKTKIKNPIESLIAVTINFYYHRGNPGDIDNLSKAVLDGCNKIAWNDDRQVIELHAYRHKNFDERTEVEITEMEMAE
jgi:crossover junction endodeoxyribonuclease RusA